MKQGLSQSVEEEKRKIGKERPTHKKWKSSWKERWKSKERERGEKNLMSFTNSTK